MGVPNENIIKAEEVVKHLNTWDINRPNVWNKSNERQKSVKSTLNN